MLSLQHMLVCLGLSASWGADQAHRAGSFTARKSQIPVEQPMTIKGSLILSQVGKQDGRVCNILLLLLAKCRSHIQEYAQNQNKTPSFDRYYLSFDLKLTISTNI